MANSFGSKMETENALVGKGVRGSWATRDSVGAGSPCGFDFWPHPRSITRLKIGMKFCIGIIINGLGTQEWEAFTPCHNPLS